MACTRLFGKVRGLRTPHKCLQRSVKRLTTFDDRPHTTACSAQTCTPLEKETKVDGVSPSVEFRCSYGSDHLLRQQLHQSTWGGAMPGLLDGRHYHISGGSSTMRAVVLREPNGKMEIELLRMPRPQTGEVLLKVRACGVCHTDLHVIKAEQPFHFPCVLGHEVTGEVVEHGPSPDPGTLRR
eukprot:jgi/Mesen1/238/ME1142375C07671